MSFELNKSSQIFTNQLKSTEQIYNQRSMNGIYQGFQGKGKFSEKDMQVSPILQESVHCVICNESFILSEKQQHLKKHKKCKQGPKNSTSYVVNSQKHKEQKIKFLTEKINKVFADVKKNTAIDRHQKPIVQPSQFVVKEYNQTRFEVRRFSKNTKEKQTQISFHSEKEDQKQGPPQEYKSSSRKDQQDSKDLNLKIQRRSRGFQFNQQLKGQKTLIESQQIEYDCAKQKQNCFQAQRKGECQISQQFGLTVSRQLTEKNAHYEQNQPYTESSPKLVSIIKKVKKIVQPSASDQSVCSLDIRSNLENQDVNNQILNAAHKNQTNIQKCLSQNRFSPDQTINKVSSGSDKNQQNSQRDSYVRGELKMRSEFNFIQKKCESLKRQFKPSKTWKHSLEEVHYPNYSQINEADTLCRQSQLPLVSQKYLDHKEPQSLCSLKRKSLHGAEKNTKTKSRDQSKNNQHRHKVAVNPFVGLESAMAYSEVN